jgi:phosphoribosylformylglycinamidine synthase
MRGIFLSKNVRRVFVEKRKGFDIESSALCRELIEYLGIDGLKNVRIINRYDIAGLTTQELEQAKKLVFSEPPQDIVYEENLELVPDAIIFAVEYLPGQYDVRADSAAQCVQIITEKERPLVYSARVFLLEGDISDEDLDRIKLYCINPVECREAALDKPESLKPGFCSPAEVNVLEGFIDSSPQKLHDWLYELNLSMDLENLACCQNYFRIAEKREPTITEIKVLDTYWSDHCRHITFNTVIDKVSIEKSPVTAPVEQAFQEYLASRNFVFTGNNDPAAISLMDLATLYMKEMNKKGLLEDLETSEEINACSIIIRPCIDGEEEEWLIMFKNETHNHPTEIEPFGGAATCLGGCIRDPLSGRSYAYQAMRITGSGDPRVRIEDTLPGKLPQRKITTEAAKGFSSYGNQVGLATGQVVELYNEGYVAKRMETGFVIGAAPRENIIRKSPTVGDVVLLLGGKTGRDGCGGATGSSLEHTEEFLTSRGAEVQKGNAPEERKIQRLFRNPQVTRLIKKGNDFGAGGVSVAVGELSDGLEIDLDSIPKKYEGLDGTELAISESQERMAVVVAPDDVDIFISLAREENLECTKIAVVTAQRRLKMSWNGKVIVDLDRDFLNTGGIQKHAAVEIKSPSGKNYFDHITSLTARKGPDIKKAWLANLEDLNVCSQKGLVEMFDSTVGAGTVIMPLGGKYQETPAEGMSAKLPLLKGETDTATLVTFGFNPALARWSPFHGAIYAVVEAVAKNVAMGGDYLKIRLSLQEYFEKPAQNPLLWGKPFSALLGAFLAQKKLGIPAVGGKDSMSGTFKDLGVPPTVVAFAVNTVALQNIISQEFKRPGSQVIVLQALKDRTGLPDFSNLKRNFSLARQLIASGMVLSAYTVKTGGLAAAISKMSFGNRIGFSFRPLQVNIPPLVRLGEVIKKPVTLKPEELFFPDYGSIILEVQAEANLDQLCKENSYLLLGYTAEEKVIDINEQKIDLDEALKHWEQPLRQVFPSGAVATTEKIQATFYKKRNTRKSFKSLVRPRVFIPVFPGTNCEYETAKAFEKAGALPDIMVFKNLTPFMVKQSIIEMVRRIGKAQMVAIPGGFSAGDEPDGTGKFIAAVFQNPRIQDAVMHLLKKEEGLMLGICNGFQALLKLGLIPYGEFKEQHESSPTLSFNIVGHHISRMVYTRVTSVLSPWMANRQVGDRHAISISHGEGRFNALDSEIEKLFLQGQVATQYVDFEGQPTTESYFNPNGSIRAVEGLTSPCGRVFGKMGHPERIGDRVAFNVPGEKDQQIFEAGTAYFR